MIPAYSESYLPDAAENLGEMLAYAVCDCGYDPDFFFESFLLSGIADQFGKGNPKYVAGMSGVELAREIIFRTSGERPAAEATQALDKEAVYWAGWALAQYQWHSGLRFTDIVHGGLTVSKVISLYLLHEADISKFFAVADSILTTQRKKQLTRLKTIRRARGFTQQQLSDASGVTLRMIQLYEQRRNNINDAAAGSLFRLANALGCQAADLLEAGE